MARLKTHYKKYATGGAVDLKVPADEPSGDASAAFQKQIDALRRAEHFAEVARQPQHGLTQRQQAFLDSNPEMLDEPERLGKAILSAHQQGFEPDSHEFHAAVAANWRNHHLEVAARNTADLHHPPGTPEHKQETDAVLDKLISDVNNKPEPEFYKPKPTPERSRSAMYSAPVSREGTMATRGSGDYDGSNPSKIKLSAEEKSICKAIGQSEVDYARGKIELARRKSEGHFDR
jgi:hypothetical protein